MLIKLAVGILANLKMQKISLQLWQLTFFTVKKKLGCLGCQFPLQSIQILVEQMVECAEIKDLVYIGKP